MPHLWLVAEYEKIIWERLLQKFDLSNLQIGTPEMFQGTEVSIMIVSSVRNSKISGIGSYIDHLDLALSRSSRFLWIVGSI